MSEACAEDAACAYEVSFIIAIVGECLIGDTSFARRGVDELARAIGVYLSHHSYVAHIAAAAAARAEEEEIAGAKIAERYFVALEILLARGAIQCDAEVAVHVSHKS